MLCTTMPIFVQEQTNLNNIEIIKLSLEDLGHLMWARAMQLLK